jgi:hypothetical protein
MKMINANDAKALANNTAVTQQSKDAILTKLNMLVSNAAKAGKTSILVSNAVIPDAVFDKFLTAHLIGLGYQISQSDGNRRISWK